MTYMTHLKLPTTFARRTRRRTARASDDPCAVFKTFVHVLAQLRAESRAMPASAAMRREKN